MLAEYLATVTDEKLRKTLTMYRLSDHSRAIETGRHRQTRLPREDRLCRLCPHRQVETEQNFLLHCDTNTHIRTHIYTKITCTTPNFHNLSDQEKLQHLLGEKCATAADAARHVNAATGEHLT